MAPFSRIYNAYKALVQVGFQPVMLNALYRFGLATGHYRRLESRQPGVESSVLRALFVLPKPEELLVVVGENGKAALIAEADEIVAGKVRLFGAQPVELTLGIPGKLEHWTSYETGKAHLPSSISDIKFVWEPARFGWAFCLGRAWHVSRDEKYAETFWRYFETFSSANPPCFGPNWTSGQEAALRLMTFVWAAQIFAGAAASTPQRQVALALSVAQHAARILPTIVYARSQQNNHLLTEAAGLLTAGLALPDLPQASGWRTLGWKWLVDGLHSQIDSYGEYAQHSTNYHRLMLQVVLWTNALLHANAAYHWPRQTNEAIVRSIHWLLAVLDPESGRTPNLGANDGAYIFPLTVCPFADYRPVLNAAARAFLKYDLPRGAWDELALWFAIPLESQKYIQLPRYLGDQLYGKDSWAYLRTAQFTIRPSHADQLHVDLWWHRLNVAQDAGTYSYNANPPWQNSLTTALVHNTVTVNGRDQFTRAGRFLYLDWFNAYRRGRLDADPAILQSIRGRHWGYWRQGVRHERTVTAFADGHWQVRDEMLPLRMPWDKRPLTYRLHWLLPDWEWSMEDSRQGLRLRLNSPLGPVELQIQVNGGDPPGMQLVRASQTLCVTGRIVHASAQDNDIRGWVSPTYGVKKPALSLAVETRSVYDVQFISEFIFPK